MNNRRAAELSVFHKVFDKSYVFMRDPMKSQKAWDHVQDVTKIALSVALLVVAPEVQLPVKVASIGVSSLNRITKFGNFFADRRSIPQLISDEQDAVFKKAWKRVQESTGQSNRKALSLELEALLDCKLNALSAYSEADLEDAIKKITDNPDRFVEWDARKPELHGIFATFMQFYDEEVLKTSLLAQYHSQMKIKELAAELRRTTHTIRELAEKLDLLYPLADDRAQPLTDDSISHYYACIEDHIESSAPLYASLPVENFFDEIINQLVDRVSGPTWRHDLHDLMLTMTEAAEGIHSEYGKLEQSAQLVGAPIQYDVAWQVFRSQTGALKWDKELRGRVSSFKRRFDKLILVSGEPGSGKTHFVRTCLQMAAEIGRSKVFFVPIDCEELLGHKPYTAGAFETFLARQFNAFFNTALKSFDMLQCDKNFKIVFAVDDVNGLYLRDRNVFKQLLLQVKAMTRYDMVSWLFTMNEFDLYMLDNDQRLLQDYCMHLGGYSNLFASTLNLTQINESKAVGGTILALYGIKQPEMAEAAVLERLSLDSVCRPVNNPFFAHILGRINVDGMIPYTAAYLEFVSELTRHVDRKLKEASGSDYLSTREDVLAIANLSLDERKTIHTATALSKLCREGTLPILRGHSLLRWAGEYEDTFSSSNLDEQVQLYTSIYWVLKMVLASIDADADPARVFERLRRMAEYQDDLHSCYLLLLDYKDQAADYTELCRLLEKEDRLHLALFASIKASRQFQKSLMEILKERESTSLNVVESFALIYYLSAYNAKMSDKYTVLNKYIRTAYTNGLSFHLDALLDRLLDQVKSLKKFKRDIKPMFLGKTATINHMLGYRLGQTYYSLLDGEPIEKQVHELVEYCRQNDDLLAAIDDMPGRSMPDYFIRAYFTKLIWENKIGLRKLYDALDRHFVLYDEKLGDVLRRNLSCAAGNVYEKNYSVAFRQEFMELIDRIISEDKARDIKFAFHFISNSVADPDEKVDPVFIPYLERMWNNPGMAEFCKNPGRNNFFINNITV